MLRSGTLVLLSRTRDVPLIRAQHDDNTDHRGYKILLNKVTLASDEDVDARPGSKSRLRCRADELDSPSRPRYYTICRKFPLTGKIKLKCLPPPHPERWHRFVQPAGRSPEGFAPRHRRKEDPGLLVGNGQHVRNKPNICSWCSVWLCDTRPPLWSLCRRQLFTEVYLVTNADKWVSRSRPIEFLFLRRR